MRRDPRAFELNLSQMDALAKLAINGKAVNRDYVGRDAAVIARAIGLELPAALRLLWGEVPNDHPFVLTEQLMPVLPVTFTDNVDSAIEFAYLAEGRNHHSAAMYSTDIGNLTRMGRRMQCSLYVKNAPTIYGVGLGEGYASMSIGTPTGDGITKTSHFVRPMHCCLVGYARIA
jgi:gamma-glutamyl phosphate reductase